MTQLTTGLPVGGGASERCEPSTRRWGRNRVCAAAAIEAAAGPDGVTRLPVLASQAPLVLRRTPEAVYLVGGAAGPLGGDRLDLRITVGPGAFLRVRSAAASIALPGLDGLESVLRVTVSVGAGGRLEYLPEPVVVTAGARHATEVTVSLAAGASLVLRDELLLGRHGEAGGTARSVLRADYDGRPLLRHAIEVSGTDAASLGPAVLAGHRAVGALLRAGETVGVRERDAAASESLEAGEGLGASKGPGAAEADGWMAEPGTGERSGAGGLAGAGRGAERGAGKPVAAVLPLAGPGVLTVALADDAVTLRRRLSAQRLRDRPARPAPPLRSAW